MQVTSRSKMLGGCPGRRFGTAPEQRGSEKRQDAITPFLFAARAAGSIHKRRSQVSARRPGSQRRALSRKIFRRTHSRKCKALRRAPRIVHLVAGREELPVTVMGGFERARRGCGVTFAETEIGRVQDAILISVQEFTSLFPVAACEVPDARSRVHGEIGIRIEAPAPVA